MSLDQEAVLDLLAHLSWTLLLLQRYVMLGREVKDHGPFLLKLGAFHQDEIHLLDDPLSADRHPEDSLIQPR